MDQITNKIFKIALVVDYFLSVFEFKGHDTALISSGYVSRSRQSNVMNTPPLSRLKINEATPTRQNVDSSSRGLVAIRSDHWRLSECAEEIRHGTDGDGTGQIQSGSLRLRKTIQHPRWFRKINWKAHWVFNSFGGLEKCTRTQCMCMCILVQFWWSSSTRMVLDWLAVMRREEVVFIMLLSNI